jgi:hypothetical protein
MYLRGPFQEIAFQSLHLDPPPMPDEKRECEHLDDEE